MKAQFSSCGKRSTKNQSEQLQPVAVGAMGLVCDEFGTHRLAAAAARVPSSKRHIPSISRLRMSVRRVRRSYARRLAARSSVFEVAHSVYKYAPNMCSFGCGV